MRFFLIFVLSVCIITDTGTAQVVPLNDTLSQSLTNGNTEAIIADYKKRLAELGIITIEDRVGQKLPAANLKKIGGRYINTEYWLNTPTLIFGWGPNHSQCMETFPMLNRIYDDLGEEIDMIAITGDESSEVKSVLFSHPLKLIPVVESRAYLKEIGIINVPKIIILDRYGEINYVLSHHKFKACLDIQDFRSCEAELKLKLEELRN